MKIEEFREYALKNMMDIEAILSEVYASRCHDCEGYVLFDGGAHKAYHTMRMVALPGCEKVYAVEADPYMAQTCLDILKGLEPGKLERIEFVQKALQRHSSITSIRWKSSTSHVGRSSIIADNPERDTIWGNNPEIQYRDEVKVEATTIDNLLSQEKRPLPFLKSDLEGADIISLFGAEATLKNKRPIVAFENSVHAPKVHGFTLEEAQLYFQQVGYVPLSFVGERMDSSNWFGFFEAWAAPTEDVTWLQTQLLVALYKRGL